MVHSWNPSTLEAELEGFRVQGKPGLRVRPCLSKIGGAGDPALLCIFGNDHSIENSVIIGR